MRGDSQFPSWLRRQLDRRNWTQADFARRLDLSPQVVSRWVSGQRIPSSAYCDLIADALSVDLDLVLEMAGHRPNLNTIDPDDPRVVLHGMIDRIDWSQPNRVGPLTAMFQEMLKDDRDRKAVDGKRQ